MVDAAELYTSRAGLYDFFVSLFRYRQGLRTYLVRSGLLHQDMSVLDAGCGSGNLSLAFLEAMDSRGLGYARLHGFDLTPAMIARFRQKLRTRDIEGVEIVEADVLDSENLPGEWGPYDLVMTAGMLEYVPRDRLARALGNLGERMSKDGILLFYIGRRNWFIETLIARPWRAECYTMDELREALEKSGFTRLHVGRFPVSCAWLNLWGHVVQAQR